MNWDYVAGFWDGEGWICNYPEQMRGKKWPYWNIGACQSTPQDLCLREIESFLSNEGIVSKIYIAKYNGPRRKPVSKLYITGDRYNKLKFLEHLIDKLIVKKEKALACIAQIKAMPIPIPVGERCKAAYQLYWEQWWSKQDAMRLNKVGIKAFNKYIQDNHLPQHKWGDVCWKSRKKSVAA